jgi:hypothetical protein
MSEERKFSKAMDDIIADYRATVDYHRKAHMSMSLLYNKWKSWTAYDLQEDGRADKTPRINHIASTIEQMVAMNSWKAPRMLVQPVSSDDMESMRAMNCFGRQFQGRVHIRDHVEWGNRMAFIKGVGIYQVFVAEDPFFMDGKDVDIARVDPENFYPDPSSIEFKDCQFVFTDKVVSKRFLKDRYGVDLEPIAGDTSTTVNVSNTMTLPPGCVVLHQAWYKPTKDFKEGRYARWIDSEECREDGEGEMPAENPTPGNKLPFVLFTNVPDVESIWGQSEVIQLYTTQVLYNRILGYITNSLYYTSIPVYQSNDPKLRGNVIPMMPNQVVEMTEGQQYFLKPVEKPFIDANNIVMLNVILQQMQNVSGVHPVSSGQAAGVTAASAIQSLAALGQQRMTVRKEHMAQAQADIFDMTLRLIFDKKLYTKKRFFRIIGFDQPVVFDPEKCKLDYDITCTFEEGMPEDVASRMTVAMQAAGLQPEQRMFLAKINPDPAFWDILTMQVEQAQGAVPTLEEKPVQVPPDQGGGTVTQQVPAEAGAQEPPSA